MIFLDIKSPGDPWTVRIVCDHENCYKEEEYSLSRNDVPDTGIAYSFFEKRGWKRNQKIIINRSSTILESNTHTIGDECPNCSRHGLERLNYEGFTETHRE